MEVINKKRKFVGTTEPPSCQISDFMVKQIKCYYAVTERQTVQKDEQFSERVLFFRFLYGILKN